MSDPVHPDLTGTHRPAHTRVRGGEREVVLPTAAGDDVDVAPWVPHREEHPDPDTPAVVVISRTTQEAIVVNLPALHPLEDS